MIDVFSPGLQYYVDKLNAGEVYTFVRLGDGEWSAITQKRSRTYSGSQTLNHQSLQRGMMKVVAQAPNDPRYILSLRQTSFRENIKLWLAENVPAHVRFHDSTVLYKASKKGLLYPWIEALRNLDVPIVVIGPERHKGLNKKVVPIARHVMIPGKNCWAQRERIIAEALQNRNPACYLLSAGPAAKVFCWSLFQRVGQRSWILDVGSLFDPYVGKRTRTYHKGMLKNPAIIRRNLAGQ
jgi:hypothetical protein